MKTGQFGIRTRLAICEFCKDVRLRSGQVAVPKSQLCRAPGRALNLSQEDRNRLNRGIDHFS